MLMSVGMGCTPAPGFSESPAEPNIESVELPCRWFQTASTQGCCCSGVFRLPGKYSSSTASVFSPSFFWTSTLHAHMPWSPRSAVAWCSGHSTCDPFCTSSTQTMPPFSIALPTGPCPRRSVTCSESWRYGRVITSPMQNGAPDAMSHSPVESGSQHCANSMPSDRHMCASACELDSHSESTVSATIFLIVAGEPKQLVSQV